ncbi:MAG: hypothetical protein PHD48_00460 [Alphaproteobacteria bacterium]|nr:hypothetical protein [Alphaproteobacteria bacterium]
MTIFFRAANKKRRGLTLTELAIVLGAMSLVMGGVWAIVGVVWDNYRYYKAKEQLVTIVNNVRDYYGPMGGIYTNSVTKTAQADGTDITQLLNDDDRRLIPMDMRLNQSNEMSDINHPLGVVAGGSFRVESQRAGRVMRIRLLRLSQTNCVKLLMEFPFLMPEMGVVRIAGSSNSADIDITNISNPGGGVPLPMSASTAVAWCGVTSLTGNEVDIDFKIRN